MRGVSSNEFCIEPTGIKLTGFELCQYISSTELESELVAKIGPNLLASVGIEEISYHAEIFFAMPSYVERGFTTMPVQRFDVESYKKIAVDGSLPSEDDGYIRVRGSAATPSKIVLYNPYDYSYDLPSYISESDNPERTNIVHTAVHEVGHKIFGKMFEDQENGVLNIDYLTKILGKSFQLMSPEFCKLVFSPNTPYLSKRAILSQNYVNALLKYQNPSDVPEQLFDDAFSEFASYLSECFSDNFAYYCMDRDGLNNQLGGSEWQETIEKVLNLCATLPTYLVDKNSP